MRKNLLLISLLFCVSTTWAESTGPSLVEALKQLDCVIEPSDIIDVGSSVPGVVERISSERSDLVHKGDVLVQLDANVEKASMELAKVRAGFDTGIKLRKANSKFDHLTQKRNQSLLSQSAISRHSMDQLETESRIADLQVLQEKDNKRIAQLEYGRAIAVLERRRIVSPVDGVVMERFKSVGEYVDDDPVVRIAKLDPLHVEVIVSVDYLGQLKAGMQAEVVSDALSNQTYIATVERIDRVADAASGTFGVRLTLPNPDYAIPAGLRCRLTFRDNLKNPQDKVAVVSDTQTEPLTEPLLQTTDTSEQATGLVVDPSAKNESSPAAEMCYSVGPFSSGTQMEPIFNTLSTTAVSLKQRTTQVIEANGFLVLARQTTDSPGSLEDKIRNLGVQDFFLLRRGENKGRVSLGYFTKKNTAERRRRQLHDLGVESELFERDKTVKAYWLDIVSRENLQEHQLFRKSGDLPDSATMKHVACTDRLTEQMKPFTNGYVHVSETQ